MRILLLFTLSIGLTAYSQQTFKLNWQQGINGPAASLNIAVGDAVEWTWTNTSTHDVTSKPGSKETFKSSTVAQNGFKFKYTFTQVGSNPYECSIHPSSMFGTITVSSTMSEEDRFIENLKMYPTVVDETTQLTSLIEINSIKIHDLNGVVAYQYKSDAINLVNLDLSSLSSGMYLMTVKATSGQTSTLKFLKK